MKSFASPVWHSPSPYNHFQNHPYGHPFTPTPAVSTSTPAAFTPNTSGPSPTASPGSQSASPPGLTSLNPATSTTDFPMSSADPAVSAAASLAAYGYANWRYGYYPQYPYPPPSSYLYPGTTPLQPGPYGTTPTSMVPGPTAPGMGPVGDYGLLQRQVVKQEPGMVPVAPGPGIGYTLGGIPMAPQVGATSPVPSDGGSSSAGSLNASLNADQQQSSPLKVYVPGGGGRVRKRPMESGKPAYSYISLICMAIGNSPGQAATLREIIEYVQTRFPYYQRADKWQSSIRHNLTLNDCFVKLAKRPGEKGCPWTLDPSFKDMFDAGSLLRRRYRFKEGTPKWHKSRKDSAKKAERSRLRKLAEQGLLPPTTAPTSDGATSGSGSTAPSSGCSPVPMSTTPIMVTPTSPPASSATSLPSTMDAYPSCASSPAYASGWATARPLETPTSPVSDYSATGSPAMLPPMATTSVGSPAMLSPMNTSAGSPTMQPTMTANTSVASSMASSCALATTTGSSSMFPSTMTSSSATSHSPTAPLPPVSAMKMSSVSGDIPTYFPHIASSGSDPLASFYGSSTSSSCERTSLYDGFQNDWASQYSTGF